MNFEMGFFCQFFVCPFFHFSHPQNKIKSKHNTTPKHKTDRDQRLERAADKIERDLILVGASAIEDRLQPGVPDAISSLAHAGSSLSSFLLSFFLSLLLFFCVVVCLLLLLDRIESNRIVCLT